MQISTMVIDDFLDDPLELRRMALTCDYPVVSEQTYFPGRNAQQQIPVTGLEGQISQILHEELDPIPGSELLLKVMSAKTLSILTVPIGLEFYASAKMKTVRVVQIFIDTSPLARTTPR
jgi:hypothetical protein